MSKCIICGRELTSGEPPEMYNNMCLKCYQEQNYAEYSLKQGVTDYQKQLKQSQTELAIRELEELRKSIYELDIGDYYLQNGGTLENIKVKRKDVYELIDQQIKELKGE